MIRFSFFTLMLLVAFTAAGNETATQTRPPADADRTTGGVPVVTLVEGSGERRPLVTDIVEMRYTVRKASDGSVIASVEPPRTASLPVNRMLPGWAEATMTMVAGEKKRAWVFSEMGGGKIPDGETFIIDTELIRIFPFPETPPDVAEVPEDAERSRSGLAWKVLHSGDGERSPSYKDTVVVHYSGWTTDGRMFDSSLRRGEPASFDLREVIPGWTEGMQLMKIGDRYRFWIPAKLAYGNERGKPRGMLVFEIELLDVW